MSLGKKRIRFYGSLTSKYIKAVSDGGILSWTPEDKNENVEPTTFTPQMSGSEMVIPLGYWSNPVIHKHPKISYDSINMIPDSRSNNYNEITLRDYQKGPYACITQTIDKKMDEERPCFLRLVMPCGFGKTIFAVKLIQDYSIKTAIVLWCSSLLGQWYESLRFAGIADDDIGIGHGSIPNSIDMIKNQYPDVVLLTVAHFQRADCRRLVQSRYDMVFIDESHKYNLNNLNNLKRWLHFYPIPFTFFLTATPRKINSFYCNDTLSFSKDNKICKKFKILTAMTNRISENTSSLYSNYSAPRDNFKVTQGVILEKDEFRQDFIIKTIADYYREELFSCGIVLTKSRTVMRNLYSKLKDMFPDEVFVADAQKAKDTRGLLMDLKRSQSFILISTLQYAGTGLDLPNLDAIFFSTISLSASDITQSAGRVCRYNPDKPFRSAILFNVTSIVPWISTVKTGVNNISKTLLALDWVEDITK